VSGSSGNARKDWKKQSQIIHATLWNVVTMVKLPRFSARQRSPPFFRES
jgi:hypothetical protein